MSILVCLTRFSSYSVYSTPFYASGTDCKEPNVEHEPKRERSQLSDLVVECKEILAGIGKILEMIVKVDTNSKPLILIEPKIVKEPEPKPKVVAASPYRA